MEYKRKMNNRVLIFIDWYRPGFRAGGPITSVANMVEQLSGDYQFRILTTDRDYGDAGPYEGIEPDVWTDPEELTGAGTNVKVCYLSPKGLSRRNLREKAAMAGCDTWYINGVYSRYFSILPLQLARRMRQGGPSRIVVAPRGMLSPHALKIKSARKNLFVAAARIFRLYRGVVFHATSQEEASTIGTTVARGNTVLVAPNLPAGMPCIGGPPDTNPLIKKPGSDKKPGSLSLLSLARISPEKNTHGALRVLSGITEGHVELRLVGETGSDGYWEACKKLIGSLPPNIRVWHDGPVHPYKLPGVMKDSHALLLPTTGENFGHAILECLSHGLPAIISDRTPWSGLQERGAGFVISINREEKFAEAIKTYIAMDQEDYDARSRAARQYAREQIENPGNLKLYKILFSHE